MALTVQRCHSVVEVILTQVQGAAKVSLQGVKVTREKDVVSETGAAVGVTGVVGVVGVTEVVVVTGVVVVTEVEVVGVTEAEAGEECAKVVGRMVGVEVEVDP